MFGIPGKAAVTLTPAAVQQIARLMARDSAGACASASRKAAARAWNTRWIMSAR